MTLKLWLILRAQNLVVVTPNNIAGNNDRQHNQSVDRQWVGVAGNRGNGKGKRGRGGGNRGNARGRGARRGPTHAPVSPTTSTSTVTVINIDPKDHHRDEITEEIQIGNEHHILDRQWEPVGHGVAGFTGY